MNRFFVDAETDGLYGRFLSAAALVTDENGRELEHFYAAAADASADSEWVRQYVMPYLGAAETVCPTEYDLLEAFWAFWMKHRTAVQCIADVGVPVEARLFTACVLHRPEEREFLAPFPLLDLSTLLLARGLDPLGDRAALSGLQLVRHDPLNDVRMAAAVWTRLCPEE